MCHYKSVETEGGLGVTWHWESWGNEEWLLRMSFLLGVMQMFWNGCGDSYTTPSRLETITLHTLNGPVVWWLYNIIIKLLQTQSRTLTRLESSHEWLRLIICGFHCRGNWLSCLVGGTANISIFVFLLGLKRFPRKGEETFLTPVLPQLRRPQFILCPHAPAASKDLQSSPLSTWTWEKPVNIFFKCLSHEKLREGSIYSQQHKLCPIDNFKRILSSLPLHLNISMSYNLGSSSAS